jgi:hypothetical protein
MKVQFRLGNSRNQGIKRQIQQANTPPDRTGITAKYGAVTSQVQQADWWTKVVWGGAVRQDTRALTKAPLVRDSGKLECLSVRLTLGSIP